MLDDRHYMRSDYRPRGSGGWGLSTTVTLMIVLTVAYVVQQLILTQTTFRLDQYLALSNEGLRHGYVWQLLTFQFLHASPGHLFGNLIGLWFVGPYVEERLGRTSFLRLYFASGVIGGLLQSLLALVLGNYIGQVTVGASAGIAGVFAALATMEPDLQFLLFFLIPLKARYLLFGSIVIAAACMVTPSVGGVQTAHAAHLGGMLFGIAYIRWGASTSRAWAEWNPLRRKIRRERMIKAATIAPPKVRRRAQAGETQELPSGEFISTQVDPILDKISAHGIQSLTEREREILQAARAKMSKP